MGFRFKVRASDLNEAINVVQIVPPRPFDKNNTSGFLFVIKGKQGFIYSHDAMHTTRAHFDLLDVEGEGAFIYPGANIKAFAFFKDSIDFEVHDPKDGEGFNVTYDGGNGAGKAPRPLFDPKWMQTCDRELEAAGDSRKFTAGVLREALNLAKDFHGGNNTQKTDDADQFKVVQVFNKNVEIDDPAKPGEKLRPFEAGDGFMFASDRNRTIHIQSEDFLGKHLVVHATHMPLLMQFLAKASGKVELRTGTHKTFAIDSNGRVFGWSHVVKSHSKFVYSSGSKGDSVITFKITKSDILNAINYIDAELETGRDKVKVVFDHASHKLQFQIAEGKGVGLTSMFVDAPVTENESRNVASFAINTSLKGFKALFETTKGNVVDFRATIANPDGVKIRYPIGAFRTFDQFILDPEGKVVGGNVQEGGKLPEGAVQCKVTRYSPSYVE